MLTPWSNIKVAKLPISDVVVQPKDDTADWAAAVKSRTLTVSGSHGHWLALAGLNVPAGVDEERLWYDGNLVATAPMITDYILSSNGLHYALTEGTNRDGSDNQSLMVDRHTYTTGSSLTSLHLNNDGATIYYSCAHCNGSSGLFRNKQLIATTAQIGGNHAQVLLGSTSVMGLSAGGCLYEPNADVPALLSKAASYADPAQSDFACSPNGTYILTSTDHNIFPVGSSNTVRINGRKVADGNTESEAVNNLGQPSYLMSDGAGKGYLVLNGKRYSFTLYTSDAAPIFSPSDDHAALVLEDTDGSHATWWLDGRNTGRSSDATISLDDAAFYVYKMSPLTE